MTLTKNYKFAKFGPKSERCYNFYENWHREKMEHANYKYSAWDWCYRPKIIDSGKFASKIEMCSNFHETWHLGYF